LIKHAKKKTEEEEISKKREASKTVFVKQNAEKNKPTSSFNHTIATLLALHARKKRPETKTMTCCHPTAPFPPSLSLSLSHSHRNGGGFEKHTRSLTAFCFL